MFKILLAVVGVFLMASVSQARLDGKSFSQRQSSEGEIEEARKKKCYQGMPVDEALKIPGCTERLMNSRRDDNRSGSFQVAQGKDVVDTKHCEEFLDKAEVADCKANPDLYARPDSALPANRQMYWEPKPPVIDPAMMDKNGNGPWSVRERVFIEPPAASDGKSFPPSQQSSMRRRTR